MARGCASFSGGTGAFGVGEESMVAGLLAFSPGTVAERTWVLATTSRPKWASSKPLLLTVAGAVCE